MSASQGLSIMQKQKVSKIMTACHGEKPYILALAGATLAIALKSPNGAHRPALDHILPALAKDLTASSALNIEALRDEGDRVVAYRAWHYTQSCPPDERRAVGRICQSVADMMKGEYRVVEAAAARMKEIAAEAGISPRPAINPAAAANPVPMVDLAELQRKAAAFDAIFKALDGRDIDRDSVEIVYAIEDLIRQHAGVEVTHAAEDAEEDASPAP